VLGTPLFSKLTVTMEDGKKMVIDAPGNSEKNLYVQSASLNGQAYPKNWISHQDLQKGGHLVFKMGATPEKSRGTQPSAFPYSYSTANK
jgi:putative alpha-1,2-mannosidase